jgi:lipoteichoic acid synthase
MLKKIIEFKSSLNFLVAVGFILALVLAANDISNAVFSKPKIDRIPFEVVKLLFFDLGVSAIFCLLICIPYLALVRLNTFLGDTILIILALVLLFINIGLNQYYASAHVPLGSDIYGYTLEEIQMILNNSSSFDLKTYFIAFSFPIAFLVFLYLLRFIKIRLRNLIPALIVGLGYMTISGFVDSHPLSNLSFFISESLDYKGTNAKSKSKDNWTDKNLYPLLVKNVFTNNVIGDNLNLKSQKPNIVIIIMEGMGRDFMGDGAQYQGFTPYLDSLSKNSLYWDNFVSNAGRSFGALPSILGSAPFGQQGFLDIEEVTHHLSMIALLKKFNYKTSYFEGGDSSFDRKINYLNNEGMENILDMSNFGSGYKKTESNAEGFSWGYPDAEIFKKTLSLIQPADNKSRLDLILTISNHEPFYIPNQDKYRKRAMAVAEKNNYDGDKMDDVEEYIDVFSTLLYTDESIKTFMNQYKNSPNYENTIFIITGDHRLIPIPQKDAICRYHVPLIISSPMLKKPQLYKGISSHMDILPSILVMLKNNFNVDVPEKLPFVGKGLSDSKIFGNNTAEIPVMRHKGTFKDMIDGDYFLSGNDLFKINDNLSISESYDGGILKKIQQKYDRFEKVNNYVTSKDMIIPKEMIVNKVELEEFTPEEKKRITQLTKSDNNNEIFQIARELAFNKKRADALLLCNHILKRSPNNVDTRTLKGRIHAFNGDYQKADQEFMFIVNRNPTYTDSYRAAITMYWWNGDVKKANNLAIIARKNLGDDKEFMKELNTLLAKFKK